MTPQVTLYGNNGPSPNPIKVMILLEELNIDYNLVFKEYSSGEYGVKSPDFIKINPNGRVPALTDHTNNNLNVWESAAILLYLGGRFDKEHKVTPASLEECAEVWQWLFFEGTGLEPNLGSSNHFLRNNLVKPPELHFSVVERFQKEAHRALGVLEKRITDTGNFIALGRFSVVDMAVYTYLHVMHHADVDINEFPGLKAYYERIKKFPCVGRAYSKVQVFPKYVFGLRTTTSQKFISAGFNGNIWKTQVTSKVLLCSAAYVWVRVEAITRPRLCMTFHT